MAVAAWKPSNINELEASIARRWRLVSTYQKCLLAVIKPKGCSTKY